MNLKKELIVVFHPYVPKGQKSIHSGIGLFLPIHYGYILAPKRTDKEVKKFFESGKEKGQFLRCKVWQSLPLQKVIRALILNDKFLFGI